MSRIKNCFTSRFGNGLIVNFDYKQLEVVALAVLSGDVNLKKDLLEGLDMHAYFAERVYGKVNPELRNKIKQLTFQLQYGATAYGMSKSTGLDKKVCENFILEYFRKYPGIATWHERLSEEVRRNRQPAEVIGGVPVGVSTMQSPTGRLYCLKEEVKDMMDYGRKTIKKVALFRQQQIKNYQVQGTATGDLVLLMCGILNRYILTEEMEQSVKLINTVHDSIMLDVDFSGFSTTEVDRFLRNIKEILESAPEHMEKVYGFKWDMPTPVDCEIGKSWGELETYIILS